MDLPNRYLRIQFLFRLVRIFHSMFLHVLFESQSTTVFVLCFWLHIAWSRLLFVVIAVRFLNTK